MRTRPHRHGTRAESTGRVARAALALAAMCLIASLAGCGLIPSRPFVNLGSGALSAAESTGFPPSLAGPVTPPARGAFVGVFHPPAPFDLSTLSTYTALTPKPLAIVMWYQPWAADGPHEFDPAACVSLYERGAIPMITWEPWDPGKNARFVVNPQSQTQWRLANIIGGVYDPYIRRFAQAVKSARGPVMIRPMHEMNGDWYPWGGTVNGNTPAQYIQAWRHIHDIFAQEGATNVTWVWSINHESLPPRVSNSFSAYYPGDAYVDWTSLSGFNFGTSAPRQSWRSFDFWYHTPLAYLKTLNKPIVISEFGSVEQGGSKAAWLTDAYARIRTQHPEVKGVVYYDSLEIGPTVTQDWRLTSSPASAQAFRQAMADPYYVGGPAPTLASWLGGLTAANWAYLRHLQPVY